MLLFIKNRLIKKNKFILYWSIVNKYVVTYISIIWTISP